MTIYRNFAGIGIAVGVLPFNSIVLPVFAIIVFQLSTLLVAELRKA